MFDDMYFTTKHKVTHKGDVEVQKVRIAPEGIVTFWLYYKSGELKKMQSCCFDNKSTRKIEKYFSEYFSEYKSEVAHELCPDEWEIKIVWANNDTTYAYGKRGDILQIKKTVLNDLLFRYVQGIGKIWFFN